MVIPPLLLPIGQTSRHVCCNTAPWSWWSDWKSAFQDNYCGLLCFTVFQVSCFVQLRTHKRRRASTWRRWRSTRSGKMRWRVVCRHIFKDALIWNLSWQLRWESPLVVSYANAWWNFRKILVATFPHIFHVLRSPLPVFKLPGDGHFSGTRLIYWAQPTRE